MCQLFAVGNFVSCARTHTCPHPSSLTITHIPTTPRHHIATRLIVTPQQ